MKWAYLKQTYSWCFKNTKQNCWNRFSYSHSVINHIFVDFIQNNHSWHTRLVVTSATLIVFVNVIFFTQSVCSESHKSLQVGIISPVLTAVKSLNTCLDWKLYKLQPPHTLLHAYTFALIFICSIACSIAVKCCALQESVRSQRWACRVRRSQLFNRKHLRCGCQNV